MPFIQAFRGLRYDLGHVGSLSEVIAPPYDVIDGELQDELYKKHPANVVRLILNRDEPGDAPDNRYDRASQFLKNWRREGVLQEENQPSVYLYKQIFKAAGQEFERSGFMCRMRLEPFGTGKVYPHEETHSAAKADRLKLINACKANLSQIFGIFPDDSNEALDLLNGAADQAAPLECTDHLGVVHRMWPIYDVNVISKLQAIMDPKPMYVADGHHRYETACNYREQVAQELGGELPSDHPANFVMTMCVSMSDPGMIVLPTHRMFRGVPSMSSDQLKAKLDECFETRIAGEGGDLATMVWEDIETNDDQGMLAFFCAEDERWLMAKINDVGRAKMAELASEHSEDWQGLGVSILHRLVMEHLLELPSLPKPMYVHSVDEVIQGIDDGDAVGRDATGQEGSGGRFELVALVMPATLDHIRSISEHGERMPAKSTYFYPKLLSGLVINPVE